MSLEQVRTRWRHQTIVSAGAERKCQVMIVCRKFSICEIFRGGMSISLMEKLSLAHPDAVYSLVMQYRMNRLGKNLIRTFQTKSIFKNLRTIFMI